MGDRFVDHMRATQLNKVIVEFCWKTLRPGGSLLMKILQGPGERDLSEFVSLNFKKMQKVKPAASRNASAETYYFCEGYDQSMDPRAVKLRDFREKMELAEGNPYE